MEHDPTGPVSVTVRDDGTIVISAQILRAMGFKPGTKVSARLTEMVLAEELRKRGIAEEEVDRIGSKQLEPRENVIRFLAAEGRLTGSKGFRTRTVR
jgi:cobalamin biosynthesis protein CbiG